MRAWKAFLSACRAVLGAVLVLVHGVDAQAVAPKKPGVRAPNATAKKKAPRKAGPRKAGTRKAGPRKPLTRKGKAGKKISPKSATRGVAALTAAPRQVPLLQAEALLPFIEALHRIRGQADATPVRILHFGDSHTAADYWTGRIRERLQQRFGDGGPGLIAAGAPWRGYPHQGVSLVSGRKWEATSLRSPLCDGWVGLAGTRLTPAINEPLHLQARFSHFRIYTLENASGTAPAAFTPASSTESLPVEAPLSIPLAVRSEWELASGSRLYIRESTEPLELAQRGLEVTLAPDARLLGVDLLSGRPGVVYDELGLNGAELLDLERWSPDLREILLRQAKPDLLVLAYGTNESSHLSLDLQDYERRAVELLTALRRESGAPILVIGPLDRSSRSKRQRAGVSLQEDRIVQTLKQAAAHAGCAFWDARQAMGGEGAILAWKRSGLAQPDLVHLTGPGYQRLGDLLVDGLLELYDNQQQESARKGPVVENTEGRP